MKIAQIIGKLGSVESLLAGAAVLVEALRAYPWLLWLGILQGWGASPFSLLSSLLVVSVTGYAAKRSLEGQRSLGKARLITLGMGMAALFLLIRLEHSAGYALGDMGWFTSIARQLPQILWALAAGLYLLWRGTVIGRESLTSRYFYINFTLGIAGFIVLVLLWTATPRTSGQSALAALSPYLLSYFFVSLLAMGLCNFRERLRETGNASQLFTRRWLLILVSVAFVIVFIAAIVAGGLSAVSPTSLLHVLNVLAGWLGVAFTYLVLYPVGILGTLLYYVLRFIVALLRNEQPPPPNEALDVPEWQKNMREVAAWPSWLTMMLEWTLLVLVVVAAVYFLARALFRYRQASAEKEADEIHQSLWSWAGFKADVLGFLKGLFARFRRKAAPRSPMSVPPISVTSDDAAQIRDIRELYRGLLWEGRQAGVPRKTGETPYEYQQTLSGRQMSDEDVAAITAAYVGERYGHRPVDERRLAALARLWLRLRSAFRQNDSVS